MNDTDNKILDAIIDLGLTVKALLEEQRKTNTRLDKLEKHETKTNLALSEIRISFMHYADRLENVIDHEKRISKLEQSVFKK